MHKTKYYYFDCLKAFALLVTMAATVYGIGYTINNKLERHAVKYQECGGVYCEPVEGE